MPVTDISGTARLTAYARAVESDRPDALFVDPYSRRLAGNEGECLGKEAGALPRMVAALAARTAVIDELLMQRVVNGDVDLVLNLGAGLDTRAWRLDLPAHIRWVDVDLPDILSYKCGLMRTERSACLYQAEAADLTQPSAVAEVLERCRPAGRILVVSEGLLAYLKPEAVGELATQMHRCGKIAWWLTDLAGPRALAMSRRSWGAVLKGVHFQFAPADPTDFFGRRGWQEVEFRSSQEEARRLARAPNPPWLARIVMAFASASLREEIRRLSGVVMFERKGSHTR